jgi:rRNA small subunit pseudouridine methyltransferase Nep1
MRSPLAWIVLFDSNVEAVQGEARSRALRAGSRLGARTRWAGGILDRSVHHFAMRSLPDSGRRGRPDIVHASILSIADAPAYADGIVNFLVHTVEDKVIVPAASWRPPRNYRNFLGLMEELLRIGRVPPKGRPILRLEKGSIEDAVRRTRADRIVLLSSSGKLRDLSEVVAEMRHRVPAYLIGGYARGGPRQEVTKLADEVVSIHSSSLSSSIVISRLLYEVEKLTGQP